MKYIIKLILLILLCSVSVNLYSQEEFEASPKERNIWFMGQRMYPFDSIPQLAYADAVKQRDSIRDLQGYLLHAPNTWWCIGPKPIINEGNVAFTGRFSTVKYAPSNPNTIYAGAANGGVWKTTDAGVHWLPITDNLQTLSSGSLAVDPDNENIIYYGTGEGIGDFSFVYYGRGIFKTTNGGANWVKCNMTPATELTYVSRIVIDPDNSQILYAALTSYFKNASTGSGLYRSTDSGNNWYRILPNIHEDFGSDCNDITIANNGGPILVCGTNANNANLGYYRSTDHGITFQHLNYLDGTINGCISISKSNPNIVYAVSPTGEFSITGYKSTDGGATFPIQLTSVNPLCAQAYYDLFIYVSPYDENLVFIGGSTCYAGYSYGGFYRSTNGGTSFSETGWSPVHTDQHNMDFYPSTGNPNEDKKKFVVVNDGGVYSTTNMGSNWIDLNATIITTQFYTVSANPLSYGNIIGGTQDNRLLRTTDVGSQIWNVKDGGDVGRVLFTSSTTALFCNSNTGTWERSSDGGNSWTSITFNGNYIFNVGPEWVVPLIIAPSLNGYVFTARRRAGTASCALIMSTNFGVTFNSQESQDIPSGNKYPLQIAESYQNPAIIYVAFGSYTWPWENSTAIYKTDNYGGNNNWLDLQVLNYGIPDRGITSLKIDPDNDDILLLTVSGFGSGHVFKSTNAGSSWFNFSVICLILQQMI